MLKKFFVICCDNKHSFFPFEISIFTQIIFIDEQDLMFINVNIFLTKNFFTSNVEY